MNLYWFKRRGIFYVPQTPQAWVIALATVISNVWLFFWIDQRSHSGSDTLIKFMFFFLLTGLVYTIIAACTSRE